MYFKTALETANAASASASSSFPPPPEYGRGRGGRGRGGRGRGATPRNGPSEYQIKSQIKKANEQAAYLESVIPKIKVDTPSYTCYWLPSADKGEQHPTVTYAAEIALNCKGHFLFEGATDDVNGGDGVGLRVGYGYGSQVDLRRAVDGANTVNWGFKDGTSAVVVPRPMKYGEDSMSFSAIENMVPSNVAAELVESLFAGECILVARRIPECSSGCGIVPGNPIIAVLGPRAYPGGKGGVMGTVAVSSDGSMVEFATNYDCVTRMCVPPQSRACPRRKCHDERITELHFVICFGGKDNISSTGFMNLVDTEISKREGNENKALFPSSPWLNATARTQTTRVIGYTMNRLLYEKQCAFSDFSNAVDAAKTKTGITSAVVTTMSDYNALYTNRNVITLMEEHLFGPNKHIVNYRNTGKRNHTNTAGGISKIHTTTSLIDIASAICGTCDGEKEARQHPWGTAEPNDVACVVIQAMKIASLIAEDGAAAAASSLPNSELICTKLMILATLAVMVAEEKDLMEWLSTLSSQEEPLESHKPDFATRVAQQLSLSSGDWTCGMDNTFATFLATSSYIERGCYGYSSQKKII